MLLPLQIECEVTCVKQCWHRSNILQRVIFNGFGFNFFARGFAVSRQVFAVEVIGRLVLLRFQWPLYWSFWWIKNLDTFFNIEEVQSLYFLTASERCPVRLIISCSGTPGNIHLSRTCTFPAVICKTASYSEVHWSV